MSKLSRIVTILSLILILVSVSYAQDSELVGPIIGTIWNGELLIYDIGAGQTWEIEDLTLRADDLQWSDDGCELLAQQATNSWVVWSFQDEQVRILPGSEEYLAPFWSPNSAGLTYTEHDRNADRTIVRNLNLLDSQTETLVTLDGLGFALEWLNTDEILYGYNGFFQIINVVNNSAENFGSPSYPRYPRSVPNGDFSVISPNRYKLAVYPLVGYSLSDFADPDNETENSDNPETGLRIIHLNDGIEREFDINNQFIIGVRWSPSSERIVVVSVANQWEKKNFTISIIEPDTGEVIPVGNFNLKYYPDLGGYVPTWSPDETRLTIQTKDGAIIYELETQISTILPTVLEGALHWSPVLNYGSEYQCN